jgi:single-stranded-DNA-specific exonuclease
MRPDSIRPTKWQVAPTVPAATRQQLSHVHPVLLQVLYNRGIIDPAHVQAFLDHRYLESADPFRLTDMDKAVARLQQAIERDETIVIYGDFDADGVTSTVLLTQALRGFGLPQMQVRPYIPDRVDEGYGLNCDALSKIKEEFAADLVITVDCGIRSVAEVVHANSIGLDMIVTDHHSLGPELPPATAVINPKRPDSTYPDTMLAGVGIAYKLAQALRQAMPTRAQFDETDLLDLVAIGTVADLAPLLAENRQLVTLGLTVLNEARRPGIAALAQVSRLKPGQLTAESIAFGLGPRLNAAGRLAHAYDAARLLAANNRPMADQFANKLNALNQQRQRLTADLTARAEAIIAPDAPILIAADAGFVSGVVGLVASRLAEQNYRPAIVMEMGEAESRGSCRSIPEFHITEALDQVAHLLERHGGHAQAAGFTVRNENLEQFTTEITAIAADKLAGLDLHPTLPIDAEISLEEVDWALFESLIPLEPTGYANPTPVFMSRNVEVISHRVVGQDGTHLQMRVTGGGALPGTNYRELAAIAFRQGEWAAHMPQFVDLVYTVGVNEWNGRRSLQLMVQDLRPAERD